MFDHIDSHDGALLPGIIWTNDDTVYIIGPVKALSLERRNKSLT